MSHSLVFAERFTDPTLAAALREHRADRAALLHAFTISFENDPRIRAAWLWGSFGRNEADDLSDLDPWLVVADDAVAEMGPYLRLYAEQSGSFISGGEEPQNAPSGGGYFSSLHEGRHGLLHLDCYWQPLSAGAELPEYAVLFDRRAEAYPRQTLLSLAQPKEADGLQREVDGGLGFAWLMFSIAAKYLARDPTSDLGLMFYPKPGLEGAAARLGQRKLFQPEDWAVPEKPLEKVERLRHLVSRTEQIRGIANAQGCTFSPLYTLCLQRYLRLVEGILK